MALHQIQQRVQEDPHEVDEVPVQRGDLDVARARPVAAARARRARSVASTRCRRSCARACRPVITKYSAKNSCAPGDVGERERRAREQVLVPFGVPLDALDREEGRAERARSARAGARVQRRCRASSSQATASATTALLVSSTAVLTVPSTTSVWRDAAAEALRPVRAAVQVGDEQAAEEQHLAGEEHPHAEACRCRDRRRARAAAAQRWRRSSRGSLARLGLRRRRSRRRSSGTDGGVSKLCVGGGERVCHSRPVAPHGLSPRARAVAQRPGEVDQRQQVADRQHAGAGRREHVEHLELAADRRDSAAACPRRRAGTAGRTSG